MESRKAPVEANGKLQTRYNVRFTFSFPSPLRMYIARMLFAESRLY